MNKTKFLNDLEHLVIAESNIAPLAIFRRAFSTKVYVDDVYQETYLCTGDLLFSQKVEQMVKLFRVSNKLFQKHMLEAIKEAKSR